MKRVLITGASRGIGLETAKLLIENSYEVWGTSRDISKLPSLKRNFHPVQLDLCDLEKVKSILTGLIESKGGFDVLINNAGSGCFGPAEEISSEEFQEQMTVLFFAPREIVKIAIPFMKKVGEGRVINVSSLAAEFAIPFMSPYSCAKAALSSFSQSLRMELHHSGIKIVDLRPGDIQTSFNNFVKKQTSKDSDSQDQITVWNRMEQLIKNAPKPEIVAKKILSLIKSKNPPPIVRIGEINQAKLAPLFSRLVPQGFIESSIRKYYDLS
jgi:short-subunit dehydrogenase